MYEYPSNLFSDLFSANSPSHGQITAGPPPHNTEYKCPAKKKWCYLVRHGAPLQLHVFLELYNDFWLLHALRSQNHGVCMGFLSLDISFTARFDPHDLPGFTPWVV
jgi:hypothetical protein